jgi:hypothetical protein
MSIFRTFYQEHPFVDRFVADSTAAVDVIMPVVHTNELWEENLRSIYREIPVNRLLIGDGGCIDDSIETARKFPRVEVFDHREYTSLGFSLCQLIEAVETPWFAYFHSDVYVPPGWFEGMQSHVDEFDWFESAQRAALLVDYSRDYSRVNRPYSGGQMGRREAFHDVLSRVEDDYLYRNEDIVLAGMIEQAGHRYGRADDVFLYHQTMHKPSAWGRRIRSVAIDVESDPAEEARVWPMQVKGIINYLQPSDSAVRHVRCALLNWAARPDFSWSEFREWVRDTNPDWLPHLQRSWLLKRRIADVARVAYNLLAR